LFFFKSPAPFIFVYVTKKTYPSGKLEAIKRYFQTAVNVLS